jgi:hypothetical protein
LRPPPSVAASAVPLGRPPIPRQLSTQARHLREVQNRGSAPPPPSTPTSASAGSATSSPVSTEQDERPQCRICLELLSTQPPVMAITCGHVYHTECIEKYWSTIDDSRPKKCPLCNYIIIRPRRVDNIPDVQILGSSHTTTTAVRCAFG